MSAGIDRRAKKSARTETGRVITRKVPRMLRCWLSIIALGLTVGSLDLACATSQAPNGNAAHNAPSSPEPCQPPPGKWEEGRDPPAFCVREVTGSVRDDTGAPLAIPVTVCGVGCFGAVSEPNGTFRVKVETELPDNRYVLFAHARPRYASTFVRLPSSPPETIHLGDIELAPLSASGSPLPADGAPESRLEVGPLTFTVPKDTAWDLTFEDRIDDIDGRVARFAKVPADRAPPFAAGAVLVYALGPFMAHPSQPLPLTVHETAGLPASALVELVAMDDDLLSPDNTSGLARVVATAHVSGDGQRIETDAGQGIDRFTWLAVRPVSQAR